MKKLLFALVVITAMLTLSACSESTGIGDDVLLTKGFYFDGIVTDINGVGVNGATVLLYENYNDEPCWYPLTTAYNSCWGDGYYGDGEPGGIPPLKTGSYYKVTARKGNEFGSSGWFYVSGSSFWKDITLDAAQLSN